MPGPSKTMTEWIRLIATPEDKALLNAITYECGDAGFSNTVRRLIREEAKRRGISLPADSQPAVSDPPACARHPWRSSTEGEA